MTPRMQELLDQVPDKLVAQLKKNVLLETYQRWVRALDEVGITGRNREMVLRAIHETMELQLCSIIAPLNLDQQHTNPEGPK